MGYYGIHLNGKALPALEFRQCEVVSVTGDGPNVCGHSLLYIGGGFGNYFHVDGMYDYPYWMDEAGFQRFLLDNKKKVVGRAKLTIPDRDKAAGELRRLLDRKWFWGVAWHNCLDFIAQIAKAGGNWWDYNFSCPIPAIKAKAIFEQQLEYRLSLPYNSVTA